MVERSPGSRNCARVRLAGALCAGWIASTAFAALAADRDSDAASTAALADLSLEELGKITISSVSRREEKLADAPAAVAVITGEDIRRSGVTSLAEALRMAPGLEVARVDSHEWAITARGFNDLFANKLLVLIDGRTIYNPIFAGVYWDVQTTLLEDIERIEVIRGPGATVWGANAVNGVINIITRSARNTQGGIVSAGGGTEDRGFASFRYGGKLSENAFYRVYGTYFNRDEAVLAQGGGAGDAWQLGQGGFRVDWDATQGNLLTLQADGYGASFDQTATTSSLTPPYSSTSRSSVGAAGGNVLGRWTRTFSQESELALQTYYDRATRDSSHEDISTFDVDLHHRFPLGSWNSVGWGLGYRLIADDFPTTFSTAFVPERQNAQLFSAFLQDEIQLVPDHLSMTLGSKLEHNDYTGVEVQPSGRILWKPTDKHSFWGAVSRAVRTPSRAESGVRFRQTVLPPGVAGPLPAVPTILGSSSFEAEDLLAYELGYRAQLRKNLSVDLATFYNVYDGLRSIEVGAPFVETAPAPTHLVLPFTTANRISGETYGVELAASMSVFDWWRVRASYTYLQLHVHTDAGSTDATDEHAYEGSSPHHQFAVHSAMDLPGHLELNTAVRYVDQLDALNVPSYVALDLRVAWHASKHLELALVGQNLLDNQHPEFKASFVTTNPTEIERAVYGKVTWRF